MFSKKPEPAPVKQSPLQLNEATSAAKPAENASSTAAPAATSKVKPPASSISTDLHIKGNLKTTGDIQVQGTVTGDIRAQLLTIGESAKITGELIADDIVVQGHVVGCVRGLKVRLTSNARVEGDIIHKTIAIESGAHFEGSVMRQDDPLNTSKQSKATPAAAASDK